MHIDNQGADRGLLVWGEFEESHDSEPEGMECESLGVVMVANFATWRLSNGEYQQLC
jgi:hypothetical protein